MSPVTIRGASLIILAPQAHRVCAVEAGGEGFEPPLTVPETAVLPLDDPPEIPDRALWRCPLLDSRILPWLGPFVKSQKGARRILSSSADDTIWT